MAEATQQTKMQAWLEATRPRVFTASFVPMGLAAVIAVEDGTFVFALPTYEMVVSRQTTTAPSIVRSGKTAVPPTKEIVAILWFSVVGSQLSETTVAVVRSKGHCYRV